MPGSVAPEKENILKLDIPMNVVVVMAVSEGLSKDKDFRKLPTLVSEDDGGCFH